MESLANWFETWPDWAQFLAKIYPLIISIDFGRYLIAAGGVYLIVNVALAGLLRERKIRPDSPRAGQMLREFFASLRTSLIFASLGITIALGGYLGWITVLETPYAWGWQYFWASLVLMIIGHDAWFYWTHRLIHHPRLFRRCHRLHHKSNNPSPWTAYSFDVTEAVINAAYVPIMAYLLPAVSPLTMFLFMAHMILRNAIGHSGYEIFPATRSGKPLFDWITTTTHHDLHHGRAGYNYGLYFTFWDRLMGTEHPDYHEEFAAAVRRDASNTKRRFALAAVALIAIVSGSLFVVQKAHAGEAPPIPQGVWATKGHGAHVRFRACDGDRDALCGDMIWSWDPQILEKLGDRTYITGLTWDGKAWSGGKLYSPDDERTYKGKITPGPDGLITLKGCAFVFCEEQVWRRLDTVPGCRAGD